MRTKKALPWKAVWTGFSANIGTDKNLVGTINDYKDAEFIVRAVNSHEALLQIAKDFGDYLNDNYDEDNISLMEAVNRAIALAEGRTNSATKDLK